MGVLILNILKIAGLILLFLILFLLLVLFLILFVPIRYRIRAQRDARTAQEIPVDAKIKVTWLLHAVSAAFHYPAEAYLRVKVLGITIFRSDQKKEDKKKETKKKTPEKEAAASVQKPEEKSAEETIRKEEEKPPKAADTSGEEKKIDLNPEQASGGASKEEKRTIAGFFGSLFRILRNIKYTILKIYDKIKHIVRNIRYYLAVIKSETFQRAYKVCSTQIVRLLKGILPKKLEGTLRIGIGDPASTGQVMAVYGILYPLLGDNIAITPDFEEQVIEGRLNIKGKITVFCILKTAWIIYFNKDLRRVMKLFKREAA